MSPTSWAPTRPRSSSPAVRTRPTDPDILGLQPDCRRVAVACPATEHAAVLEPVEQLRAAGRPVTVLPVDSAGLVDLDVLAAQIGPSTLLVSVMAVNNETGVRAQLPAIAELVHCAGALLHTDATQLLAWGAVEVDMPAWTCCRCRRTRCTARSASVRSTSAPRSATACGRRLPIGRGH